MKNNTTSSGQTRNHSNFPKYKDVEEAEFTEIKTDWSSFQQFIESKDLFLLIYSANSSMFHIIPKHVFLSPDEELAFTKMLISKNICK